LAALSAFLIALVLGVLLGGKIAQRQPKARKTSNMVLVVLGVFVLVFIITMIVTFWIKGSVPDTLIQYTLGAGGLEAVALSAIKITKVKCGSKNKEESE
jgi:uncharacterized membrane protein